jgi:hypothetical protein
MFSSFQQSFATLAKNFASFAVCFFTAKDAKKKHAKNAKGTTYNLENKD